MEKNSLVIINNINIVLHFIDFLDVQNTDFLIVTFTMVLYIDHCYLQIAWKGWNYEKVDCIGPK